jgi:hypothetical protein
MDDQAICKYLSENPQFKKRIEQCIGIAKAKAKAKAKSDWAVERAACK